MDIQFYRILTMWENWKSDIPFNFTIFIIALKNSIDKKNIIPFIITKDFDNTLYLEVTKSERNQSIKYYLCGPVRHDLQRKKN